MRNYTIQGAFELGIRKKSPKTSIYSRSYWIRRSSRGYRQVQFVLSFRHRCGCSEWSDAYSPVPFLTVYFLLITETFHIAQVKRVLHTMYQVFCNRISVLNPGAKANYPSSGRPGRRWVAKQTIIFFELFVEPAMRFAVQRGVVVGYGGRILTNNMALDMARFVRRP